MTEFRIDRRLRFLALPAFLAVVGSRDRVWWRVAVTPVIILALVVFSGIATQGLSAWLAQYLGGALSALLPDNGSAQALPLFYGVCPTGSVLSCGGLNLIQASLPFVLAVPLILVALRLIMGRRMLTWLTSAGRFRWRLFGVGLVLAMTILAPFDLLAARAAGATGTPPLLLPEPIWIKLLYGLACVAMFPVIALFEEVFCRGWLLQQSAAFTRNLPTILFANALVFAFFHGTNDLGANLGLITTGLVLSYAALRLGGLEFPLGAHAANNLLIALFIRPFLNEDAPVSTWTEAGLDIAGSLALIAAVELVARWGALARWTGVSSSAAAAPGPSAPEAIPGAHP